MFQKMYVNSNLAENLPRTYTLFSPWPGIQSYTSSIQIPLAVPLQSQCSLNMDT